MPQRIVAWVCLECGAVERWIPDCGELEEAGRDCCEDKMDSLTVPTLKKLIEIAEARGLLED